MPPAPSSETISYGPSFVPEARFISGRNYRLGSELGNQSQQSEAPAQWSARWSDTERWMERRASPPGLPSSCGTGEHAELETQLSLVLALHRCRLWGRQRLRGLPRFCRRTRRPRWRRRRRCNSPLANLNRPLVAIHHQPRPVCPDRPASARLLVAVVDFNLVEVTLNLARMRPRLNFYRRIRRNRNLHVTLAIIDLNIPRLIQSDLDRSI